MTSKLDIDHRILEFFDISKNDFRHALTDSYEYDISEQSLRNNHIPQEVVELFLKNFGIDIIMLQEAIQYGFNLESLIEAKNTSLEKDKSRTPKEILSMILFEIDSHVQEYGTPPSDLPSEMSNVNTFIDTHVNQEIIDENNENNEREILNNLNEEINIPSPQFAYNEDGIITSKDILDIANPNCFSYWRLKAACLELFGTDYNNEVFLKKDETSIIYSMISQFKNFKEGFISVSVIDGNDNSHTLLSYISTEKPGGSFIGATKCEAIACVEYPQIAGSDITIAMSQVGTEKNSIVYTKMWIWVPEKLVFMGIDRKDVENSISYTSKGLDTNTKHISLSSKDVTL